MRKVDQHKRTNDLIRWASNLGKKYNMNTLTILVQFRRIRNAGVSIEQAKGEIERLYAS